MPNSIIKKSSPKHVNIRPSRTLNDKPAVHGGHTTKSGNFVTHEKHTKGVSAIGNPPMPPKKK